MTIHRTDAAPSPESDEQYVREVIDSAMFGTRPHLDLTAGALARGRRLRTRRRFAVASVAVASVAAAASVLAAATAPSVLDGSAGDGEDIIATQPPAPEPGVEAPRGWWDMPSRTMVSNLTDMLPDGVVLADSGSLEADTAAGGPGRGFINSTLATEVNGEIVTGNVNVMLTWSIEMRSFTVGDGGSGAEINGLPAALTCPGNLVSPTSCTEIRDPDGGRIGRRSMSVVGGIRVLEVALASGDGIVYGATANTDDDKWGADSPVTAPRPPLTMAQLEAIVRNEAWTSYRP